MDTHSSDHPHPPHPPTHRWSSQDAGVEVVDAKKGPDQRDVTVVGGPEFVRPWWLGVRIPIGRLQVPFRTFVGADTICSW